MLNNVSSEELQRLGLTSLQTKILVALFELGGEATVPDMVELLSRYDSVNRTSIYSVVNKLEQLNLVETSSSSSRSVKYTLTSLQPQQLIERIVQPQHNTIEKLIDEMQKAKIRGSTATIDREFFFLDNSDKIINQVKGVLGDAEEYVLVMGTSLMLSKILPDLIECKDSLEIFIQPTWNPDPNIDFGQLIERLRELFGDNRVNEPLPIFSNLQPILEAQLGNLSDVLRDLITTTHFIQLIADNGMVIGSFMNYQEFDLASGMFSRENMVSQMFHIIFANLFHNTEGMDQIVQTLNWRFRSNLEFLSNIVENHEAN